MELRGGEVFAGWGLDLLSVRARYGVRLQPHGDREVRLAEERRSNGFCRQADAPDCRLRPLGRRHDVEPGRQNDLLHGHGRGQGAPLQRARWR